MKRFLLSVCAVLIFAIAPSSAGKHGDTPKEEYQRLMVSFDAGDWDLVNDILNYLDTAGLSAPQKAYVHLVDGRLLMHEGMPDKAVVAFMTYNMYDGKPAFSNTAKSWGYRGLAEAYLATKDYEKGLIAINNGIDLESSDRNRWIKSRILFNSGEYEEAQSWLEQFLLVDKRAAGKASYHNLLGLTYIHLDDYDSAIDVLRPATKMKGAKAYVHNNLGLALLSRDAISYASAGGSATLTDLKEGVSVLTKAVELGSGTAVGSLANAKAALEKRDN